MGAVRSKFWRACGEDVIRPGGWDWGVVVGLLIFVLLGLGYVDFEVLMCVSESFGVVEVVNTICGTAEEVIAGCRTLP
jgi:hypothetical protein